MMEGKMLYVYGKKGKYSTIKAKGAEPSMHLSREFGGTSKTLPQKNKKKLRSCLPAGEQLRRRDMVPRQSQPAHAGGDQRHEASRFWVMMVAPPGPKGKQHQPLIPPRNHSHTISICPYPLQGPARRPVEKHCHQL